MSLDGYLISPMKYGFWFTISLFEYFVLYILISKLFEKGRSTITEHLQTIFKEGELVGLIGPNGAGKTTVFNMLTGVYIPTSGTVELRGEDVTKMSAHNRVKMGIARTFQNIRLFKRM